MNGRTIIVETDRHVITTEVRARRVRLDFSRSELGVMVAALALLTADARQNEKQRNRARDLLWRVVDEAHGPSRTIDQRTET